MLPFTAQNIVSDVQQGVPPEQAAIGGAINAVGLKTAPMSHTELRDIRLQSLYGPEVQATIDGLNDLGIRLGYVDKKLDMALGTKGGEVELTSQQRDELQSMTEDVVFGGLRATFASKAFQALPNDKKTEFVKARITFLKKYAREVFRPTLAKKPTTANGSRPATIPSSRADKKAEYFRRLREKREFEAVGVK